MVRTQPSLTKVICRLLYANVARLRPIMLDAPSRVGLAPRVAYRAHIYVRFEVVRTQARFDKYHLPLTIRTCRLSSFNCIVRLSRVRSLQAAA